MLWAVILPASLISFQACHVAKSTCLYNNLNNPGDPNLLFLLVTAIFLFKEYLFPVNLPFIYSRSYSIRPWQYDNMFLL